MAQQEKCPKCGEPLKKGEAKLMKDWGFDQCIECRKKVEKPAIQESTPMRYSLRRPDPRPKSKYDY